MMHLLYAPMSFNSFTLWLHPGRVAEGNPGSPSLENSQAEEAQPNTGTLALAVPRKELGLIPGPLQGLQTCFSGKRGRVILKGKSCTWWCWSQGCVFRGPSPQGTLCKQHLRLSACKLQGVGVFPTQHSPPMLIKDNILTLPIQKDVTITCSGPAEGLKPKMWPGLRITFQ